MNDMFGMVPNVWHQNDKMRDAGAIERLINSPNSEWLQQQLTTNSKANLLTDRPYVINLCSYFSIAQQKVVFEFKHPNWKSSSNARTATLTYIADENCEVVTFSIHFVDDC